MAIWLNLTPKNLIFSALSICTRCKGFYSQHYTFIGNVIWNYNNIINLYTFHCWALVLKPILYNNHFLCNHASFSNWTNKFFFLLKSVVVLVAHGHMQSRRRQLQLHWEPLRLWALFTRFLKNPITRSPSANKTLQGVPSTSYRIEGGMTVMPATAWSVTNQKINLKRYLHLRKKFNLAEYWCAN